MHQRLVREYVPFASACLNSHNADKTNLGFFNFAHAAFLCAGGKTLVATQRKSPKRPSKSVMISESETVLSLQLDPTRKEPPLLPLLAFTSEAASPIRVRVVGRELSIQRVKIFKLRLQHGPAVKQGHAKRINRKNDHIDGISRQFRCLDLRDIKSRKTQTTQR